MNHPVMNLFNEEPSHVIQWVDGYAHATCSATGKEFDIDENELLDCPECNLKIVWLSRIATQAELDRTTL